MFLFPSAPDLYARAIGAFRSIGGFDAAVRRNNLTETAKVIAGGQQEDYGRLAYVGRQAFAVTAEGEYLEAKAAEVGLGRRPAQGASGFVTVTAADALALAAGAQLQRGDGWVYATTAVATLSGAGSFDAPVVAVSNPPINSAGAVDGSGPSGDCDAATPLVLISGATGPGASTATAVAGAAGIAGGLAVEDDGPPYTTDLSTLRGRLLWRLRNPPHGGAPSDYVLWASSVPGVTRVFVERRWRGPGTVRVFPLFDNLFADGVPDSARVAAVQAVIEAEGPSASICTVAAATRLPTAVAVSGLTPNSAALQAAVAAELADAFRRLSRPAGVDYAVPGLDFLATPFSFAQIWIAQAIANASGERRAIVTAPLADIAASAGQMPTLGALTFS